MNQSAVDNTNDRQLFTSIIEDVPNDVFMEIFEYLDGCDIFNAFSNLNFRFENLLHSSCLFFKIKLTHQSKLSLRHQCNRIIIPNKHRIISLHTANSNLNPLLFEFFTIDASFIRLESIVLHLIPSDDLEIILIGLYSLPRLCSLTIFHKNPSRQLNNIYFLILDLPMLKYCQLSITSSSDFILSTDLILKHHSIQYLVCCEPWHITNLPIFLSYTPQLKRLVCDKLLNDLEYTGTNEVSTILPCLTHLTINHCSITFADFERLIRSLCSHLQVLCINAVGDVTYLNIDRWEKLILEYLPDLCLFDFRYEECVPEHFKFASFHMLMKRITLEP